MSRSADAIFIILISLFAISIVVRTFIRSSSNVEIDTNEDVFKVEAVSFDL